MIATVYRMLVKVAIGLPDLLSYEGGATSRQIGSISVDFTKAQYLFFA